MTIAEPVAGRSARNEEAAFNASTRAKVEVAGAGCTGLKEPGGAELRR